MAEEEEKLMAVCRQQARSLEDRIRIMKAMDDRSRLHRHRQTDIQTAQAVTGSCPDMCPEYERYCREDRSQVSPLEMTGGQPDEHKMVKEYRRSGADQLEPLPNELRPPRGERRRPVGS